MSGVIPQTAMQRVIPNAVLGRVSAVFLTGEAAATLVGAVAGPFLAQAAHFAGVATAASLGTLSAAALTFLIVPRMSPVIPASAPRAGGLGSRRRGATAWAEWLQRIRSGRAGSRMPDDPGSSGPRQMPADNEGPLVRSE
ncbi:MAG TPA: hypothetical protein VMU94_20250 [Streptosporangiaceae bacterium]|nr:hypothetical protein [Streptosporangiaceae bacterium]